MSNARRLFRSVWKFAQPLPPDPHRVWTMSTFTWNGDPKLPRFVQTTGEPSP
jgi:hypothetical protein